MSRISSSLLTFAASLLTLASCDEKPSLTEPETIAPAAPAFAIAANSWASKASMPTARCLRAAGGLTNASGQAILYAIGGDVKCGSSDPVTSVEAYNVATNTWRTRAPLPARLFELNQAAVIGKKIYVTGGLVEPEFPFSLVSALFVYDQVTNTWTRKSDMPSAGYAVTSGVAGVINGKLYVLNGFTYTPCEGDCGETRPDFYRYDPATDTWISSKDLGRPIPPCPGGHELGSAAVINGKFYVAGGRWGNGISNKLHVYDPVTNSWTEKARPLRRRWGTAGVNLNGKLYAIGGRDENGNYLNSVQAYDPATNTWSNRASMPTARAFLAAVRINSGGIARAFVLGGYNGTTLRTNEVYTP